MEVKPGYQQTEVGVIPEDWEISGLQQACRETITYGIVQCGPHIRDGVPYIRVSDMDEPELTVDAMLRTSKSIASKFARSTVEEGDLVYALRGKLGEVRQVRAELAGANLTQGTARLSPNDRLVSDYLVWAMRDPRAVRQAALEAKGTTFREITLADLRRIKVLVPPKPEQRAIAAALSDVDGLLGGLDRLIAKKRDLKQAAMQQLLTGQTRLPGFHGEWEVVTAREIGVFRGGSGFPLEAQGESSGDYPFFKVSDMNNEGNETFMTSANHWISEHTRKRLGANAFPANAIVFAKVGAAIFLERKKILGHPSCIDNNMAAFVLDQNRADVRFVHTLLLSKKLGSLVATTALPALNGKQLGEMVLTLPPLPEQTAIATVLSEMDGELAVLEQRREKTRALKQAMMQELLTGRTRLI